jgi:hypothetical protein
MKTSNRWASRECLGALAIFGGLALGVLAGYPLLVAFAFASLIHPGIQGLDGWVTVIGRMFAIPDACVTLPLLLAVLFSVASIGWGAWAIWKGDGPGVAPTSTPGAAVERFPGPATQGESIQPARNAVRTSRPRGDGAVDA